MEQLYHGHVGGISQGVNVDPIKSTPIYSMSNALSRVPDLRGRLAALSEKLCGPLPPQGVSAEKAPGLHGGIFGAVEEEARRLNYSIDDINAALTRIEEALP